MTEGAPQVVYHAIATTKTWCGQDVITYAEGGSERPVPLVAPSREQVNCPACLEAMPEPPPTPIKASEVVRDRLEAERKRFEHRQGAPPDDEDEAGIDRKAVARKVKEQLMKYTVVGIYEEPLGQRFGTVVEAPTPQAAEIAAKKVADDGLLVAAVFAGSVISVDMYTDGYSFGVPA